MPATSQEVNEWIDGFLFVANKPILDLLNTKPVLADGPTELLPDVRALERWLIASGMVTSPKTKAIVRGWRHSTEAAAFLERADCLPRKIEGGRPADRERIFADRCFPRRSKFAVASISSSQFASQAEREGDSGDGIRAA